MPTKIPKNIKRSIPTEGPLKQMGMELFGNSEKLLGEPIRDIKHREQKQRGDIDLYLERPVPLEFPALIFPNRYEGLKNAAKNRNIPLKPIITPVQDAIKEVEKELKQIEETGRGNLFVLSGKTGSGKTTFLNTLDLFIDDVGIYTIKLSNIDSRENIENALAGLRREDKKFSIVVLEGKEALGALLDKEIDVLLTTMNIDFRKDVGRNTLFVIPTTSQEVADQISNRAADVGSMVSRGRPFYIFKGPQRNEYIPITNDTLRTLNDSRNLLQYGVAENVAKGLAESATSIGVFMESCYNEIQRYQDALTESFDGIKRKRIHLWTVFSTIEENARRNHDIIRSLTFGDLQHVQIERMLTGDSAEARYWEDKQGAFSQTANYLDLRIMYLPMRTANAIATAYGHDELLQKLKKMELMGRPATRDSAQNSLGGTAIGKFLQKQGFVDRDPSKRGKPTEEQKKTFKEIVSVASTDDKALNAAVADALRDWLKQPDYKVATNLALNENKTLIADVAVVTPTDIYCLEFKWRSSELHDSEVIRQTIGRVKEYALYLPELVNLLKLPPQ